jgi:hypothetical protein
MRARESAVVDPRSNNEAWDVAHGDKEQLAHIEQRLWDNHKIEWRGLLKSNERSGSMRSDCEYGVLFNPMSYFGPLSF